ncbi:MAG: polysaccharide biosynthesis tyrosine autokinase [Fimbriimonadaceae bacterium]|nr:polysaccharide biosynthesis tyrosine autokinase [Fimbriimonadaceae bacterium]
MNLQDLLSILRARWLTVVVTALVTLVIAIAATLLTTPMYEASTRLFVSTAAGNSLTDAYQGSRFSQERVLSYSQLITGSTLAQRTVDKLGLDMSAEDLAEKVKASAKPDTVLVDVKVIDESPVRARDIANTLSDEFVLMVRELETPEDGSKPDARVVVEQRASMPDAPVTPKKKRNIGLGLFVGVALGVALAVLRDWLDNTVKSRETLESITHVGLVGTIPLDKELRKEHVISFEGDNSTIAESFRKLRTNLQFLAVDNPPRLILIASSLPGEGKSTTAINLALALAEAGDDVVVVDGDMRRPKMDRYLGVVGAVGFSTVLSGAVTLEDALQETRYPRLTVLTSGAVPPNPSELLGSMTAKKILSDLRARFDYVIVDSSPLLAVTDAAILAANSDGVLAIARFGETKREQLTHAIKTLDDVGAPVLGSVFTMTPVRGAASYSYNYGYYGEDDGSKPAAASAPASAIAAEPPREQETSEAE